MNTKPNLSFWQIWNMCFGFLGIQFGFALQNANVSRIFQTLGADMSTMPLLWVAAPLTGLLVQPIIGYWSDKTWNRFGRRRPFFILGAILTSMALIAMPHSSVLWIAAGMLWVLDASINITMEPFRAFVGDMLPSKQRPFGYVMQTVFIGIGAIIASALPYILTNFFEISNTAQAGEIPDSVRLSFYLGAVVLFVAVMWTVIRTKEYSPEELDSFTEASIAQQSVTQQESLQGSSVFSSIKGVLTLGFGVVFALLITWLGWDPQLYILAGGVVAAGLIQVYASSKEQNNELSGGFYQSCRAMMLMPETMRRLAVVQFFSWFALFAMWIYTTAAVSSHHFLSTDPTSQAYNEGADWVGVLFATYNGVTIFAAMLIPIMHKRIGLIATHQMNLVFGAIGFLSFLFIQDPRWLIVSMIGVGFAWASILSIPYALLADALPSNKMGFYMGVFNFFIVIPQLVAASILGLFVKYLFGDATIYVMVVAAVSWLIAAAATQRVQGIEQA